MAPMGWKHRVTQQCVTCQVEARAAAQVPTHELAQVEASSSLFMEPVLQPARLVRHQDGLVLRTHALICYPSKIPAQPA